MNHNNELNRACQAWLHAGLNLLATKQVTYKKDIKVTFTDNGYHTEEVQIIDPANIWITFQHELFTLAEFDHIIHIVEENQTLIAILFTDNSGKLLEKFVQRLGRLQGCLSTFLIEYIRIVNGFDFSTDVYNHIYEKLEHYIFDNLPFESFWSVHLRNLSSDMDDGPIDRNLKIRRATHDEKLYVLRKPSSPYFTPDIPEFYLSIQQPIDRADERTFNPNPQGVSLIAQRIVLALRLLKPNPIGIASYYWCIPEQPFVIHKGATYMSALRYFDFKGEPYILTQTDIHILQKLWRKTRSVYTDPKLSIAVTRFEDAYLRTKIEDKLIDYWTALEALFLSDESNYQMSKTLSLAIAYYLGRNEEERQSIKNDIVRSHNLRSDVVHGKQLNQNANLIEMVTKTEQHLRNALRKRIEEI